MPLKVRDDISKGSGVIALTDRETDKQTDITENNSTLAARMVNVTVGIHQCNRSSTTIID